MRRINKVFAVTLLVFLLVMFLPFPLTIVSAEAISEYVGLEESIKEALENLDLSDLEKYIAELESNGADLKTRLLEYIKGGEVEYQSIFKQIFSVFFGEVIELLPVFSTITAIALLCGILAEIQATTFHKQLGSLIEIIAFSATIIPILQIFSKCFLATSDGILKMKEQMDLFFPVLLTLLAASGGSVSVAICKPSIAFLSTTMVGVISKIILPLILLIFFFAIVNRMSNEFKVGKFIAVFKSINKWLIGIGVSIFGLFFTTQGITAVTYDGIARRAAKYAIGNGIPIIGGFLSSGFDLAIAGSILIKNSLGYLGILVMITTVLEPILLLCSVTILLRCCSAVTSPFSDNRISDFLSDTADSINYLSAGLLFTAFLYFLSIIIFISCTGGFF